MRRVFGVVEEPLERIASGVLRLGEDGLRTGEDVVAVGVREPVEDCKEGVDALGGGGVEDDISQKNTKVVRLDG